MESSSEEIDLLTKSLATLSFLRAQELVAALNTITNAAAQVTDLRAHTMLSEAFLQLYTTNLSERLQIQQLGLSMIWNLQAAAAGVRTVWLRFQLSAMELEFQAPAMSLWISHAGCSDELVDVWVRLLRLPAEDKAKLLISIAFCRVVMNTANQKRLSDAPKLSWSSDSVGVWLLTGLLSVESMLNLIALHILSHERLFSTDLIHDIDSVSDSCIEICSLEHIYATLPTYTQSVLNALSAWVPQACSEGPIHSNQLLFAHLFALCTTSRAFLSKLSQTLLKNGLDAMTVLKAVKFAWNLPLSCLVVSKSTPKSMGSDWESVIAWILTNRLSSFRESAVELILVLEELSLVDTSFDEIYHNALIAIQNAIFDYKKRLTPTSTNPPEALLFFRQLNLHWMDLVTAFTDRPSRTLQILLTISTVCSGSEDQAVSFLTLTFKQIRENAQLKSWLRLKHVFLLCFPQCWRESCRSLLQLAASADSSEQIINNLSTVVRMEQNGPTVPFQSVPMLRQHFFTILCLYEKCQFKKEVLDLCFMLGIPNDTDPVTEYRILQKLISYLLEMVRNDEDNNCGESLKTLLITLCNGRRQCLVTFLKCILGLLCDLKPSVDTTTDGPSIETSADTEMEDTDININKAWGSSLLLANRKRQWGSSDNGQLSTIRSDLPSKFPRKDETSDKRLGDLVYARDEQLVELIHRLAMDSTSATGFKNEFLLILSQFLLFEVKRPHLVIPTMEQYREIVPKVSILDWDRTIRSLFLARPNSLLMLSLIHLLSHAPSEMLQTVPLMRSLLVNLISMWPNQNTATASAVSTFKPNPSLHAPAPSFPMFEATCVVLDCIRNAQWVPAPLNYFNEFLSFLTGSEVADLLIVIWNFLLEHPPGTFDPVQWSVQRQKAALQPYLRSVKRIVHNHIDRMGSVYARLFS